MPNRLLHEHSLYLRQHAHNPVDWYPWGEEAFARARAENKPVLVSIGYAACHWCHVMERESFEDEDTARYMNAHFICIKVDREERPDVDSIYMDAVQAISGSGGWPMNVFVTPDKIPFYGGTYFPPRPAYGRASWMQVLERLHELWMEDQDAIQQQAAQMQNYLAQAAAGTGYAPLSPDVALLDDMTKQLLKIADKKYGGFSRAPKFPGSLALSFLLDRYRFAQDEAALQQAVLSLDKMAAGGIYDQLGGGFARYSTDDQWLAPHFEKMLYDNALLVLTYCQAYELTAHERYRQVIEETIAFVNRELKGADGEGFYSALDADSEGVEGKFYTFTWQEWLEACGEPLPLAASHFGVTKAGNWEGTNILHLAQSPEAVGRAAGVPETAVLNEIATARQRLWQSREKRVRPATDDKVLLSWNALMNLALSRAAIALQDENYLNQAQNHMQWLLRHLQVGETLYHVWRQGEARIMAHLDDAAFLIQALLQLAAASGQNKWLEAARIKTEQTLLHFSDEASLFFFFTDKNQQDVPLRKIEVQDGATPAANGLMAHNLMVLGLVQAKQEWLGRGQAMTGSMAAAARQYPYTFGYWCQLLQWEAAGWQYLVAKEKPLRLAQLAQLPGNVYAMPAEKQAADSSFRQAGYYVCTAAACRAPMESWEEILALVNKP